MLKKYFMKFALFLLCWNKKNVLFYADNQFYSVSISVSFIFFLFFFRWWWDLALNMSSEIKLLRMRELLYFLVVWIKNQLMMSKLKSLSKLQLNNLIRIDHLYEFHTNKFVMRLNGKKRSEHFCRLDDDHLLLTQTRMSFIELD